MNRVRSIVLASVALMAAAFALPAAAADKLFSISAKTYTTAGAPLGNVIPTGTTPSIVLIDFFNKTPTQANSVIKSVKLDMPADVVPAKYSAMISNNAVCPAPTASLALTSTATSSLTLNGLSGVKPNSHLCVYVSVTTSAATCTAATWSGQANTGTNFGGGTPFTTDGVSQAVATAQTVDGCTGVMGCDTGTTSGNNVWGTLGGQVFTDSAFIGSADWGLVRGPNTSGACAPVPFQFTLDTNTNVASFIVSDDAKGGQGVAVEYIILWPSSATVDGWNEARPKLAWGVPGNVQPPPAAFVPALACLEDPADPLGLTMDVMPTIPNTPAFAAAAATYPQYTPGTKAKVCVSQHGWTSNAGKIQYWDKIIDLADAWVLPN